tara:strand:+ start:879 stop:1643 length:765 start_codon:yes stop_codon:yes gene_type:complete
MAYNDDIIQGGNLPGAYNPNNQIMNSPSQGPGSGNGVQPAVDSSLFNAQGNQGAQGAQGSQFTGDPLSVLQSFFPDTAISELSKYTQFAAPISQELYDAANEDDVRYDIQFGEEADFLGARYGDELSAAKSSLFGAQEKLRGSAGKRAGLGLGRDFAADISEDAGLFATKAANQFGKGLYDIKSSIADEISRNKLILSQAEAERRRGFMDLARLGEFLVDDPNADDNPYSNLPSSLQNQIDSYYQEQSEGGYGG